MAARDRRPPSDDFASALGDVKPIAGRDKHVATPSRAASGPHGERPTDELVHPEPHEPRLAHRRSVSPRAFDRLRRGELQPNERIDLHRLRAAAAEQAVLGAIERLRRSGPSGRAVLLVVHGRGRHRGGESVLREALPEWLARSERVLAWAPEPAVDGGAGATLVLLRGR